MQGERREVDGQVGSQREEEGGGEIRTGGGEIRTGEGRRGRSRKGKAGKEPVKEDKTILGNHGEPGSHVYVVLRSWIFYCHATKTHKRSFQR